MRRSSQLAHAAGSFVIAICLLFTSVLPLSLLMAGDSGCAAKCCRRGAKSCCCKGKIGAKPAGVTLKAPPACPSGCRFQLAAPSSVVADAHSPIALPLPGIEAVLPLAAATQRGVRPSAAYSLFSRPPPALL
ncbi:MAG: hypothetical protein J0L64_12545 [Acidobacteria bacterium]|nr:hypothetical protein [Acidobacteriota bacterium]